MGAHLNLAAFVEALELCDPAAQHDLVNDHIDMADDGWLNGTPGDAFSLVLFGLQAIGINNADAIRQWRRLARTYLGGFAAIDHDPRRRPAMLDWAAYILGYRQHVSTALLRNACTVALALSASPHLRTLAAETKAALDLTPTRETA